MPKNKPRTTFGIKNKEGKIYKDIILAFLLPRIITCEDFDIGYITHNDIDYILDTDKKVRTQLGLYGSCNCFISFQIRKNVKMAVARIYIEKEEKEN